jgi:hypothetical protein
MTSLDAEFIRVSLELEHCKKREKDAKELITSLRIEKTKLQTKVDCIVIQVGFLKYFMTFSPPPTDDLSISLTCLKLRCLIYIICWTSYLRGGLL